MPIGTINLPIKNNNIPLEKTPLNPHRKNNVRLTSITVACPQESLSMTTLQAKKKVRKLWISILLNHSRRITR